MTRDTLPGLEEPTWRSVSGGSRREALTHAVRGGHTLCGLAERTTSWADTEIPTMPRCRECAAVPAGHGTVLDIKGIGLTDRQLQYWTEQGWLRPTVETAGSGHRRTFPPAELAVAEVMFTLTQAGLTPRAAHRAARHQGWLTSTVRVVVEEPLAATLIPAGRRVSYVPIATRLSDAARSDH